MNDPNHKWWVLLAVGVGAFMSAMNMHIVNIILPLATREFNTDISTIEWVVTVYLLIVSSLLLSFGRLGDLRGHKSVYLFGFVIFTAASPLCGFAPNEFALIAFRAAQAFGAAMVFSNSPAILTKNFPGEERGRALGLQAMITYLGLMTGPSLGGWLASGFGWRAVFFINLPIGLLALFLSWRFIPEDVPTKRVEKFDLAGAFTFMTGLGLLLLGLNQGHAWGWTSPSIVALLAVAILTLFVFVFIEQHIPSPMLDLSLFTRRLFSASVASALCNYVCVYSIMFLMPFYLIQGRGFDPAQAGLLLTAQPLVMATVAPISGALSDRIGARLPATLGMLVLALGLYLLSRLGATALPIDVALALAVVGLGTGIFISPNSSALLGSAPRHRQGIASGILATARNAGMVLGVAMSGAIFATLFSREIDASLFVAVQTGFLVASMVALFGALTSAVRGSSRTELIPGLR